MRVLLVAGGRRVLEAVLEGECWSEKDLEVLRVGELVGEPGGLGCEVGNGGGGGPLGLLGKNEARRLLEASSCNLHSRPNFSRSKMNWEYNFALYFFHMRARSL